MASTAQGPDYLRLGLPAGRLDPAAVGLQGLPASAVELVEAALPQPATVQASPAPAPVTAPPSAPMQRLATAPLAQVAGNSVLTITKTISGTGSGPFDLTITGPSGYLTTTTIDGGQTKLLIGLANGIYTVTEATPSGWTTIYTATTGYSTGSSAVASLTNQITVTTFAAAQITGTVYADYNSNGQITANRVITDIGVQ